MGVIFCYKSESEPKRIKEVCFKCAIKVNTHVTTYVVNFEEDSEYDMRSFYCNDCGERFFD